MSRTIRTAAQASLGHVFIPCAESLSLREIILESLCHKSETLRCGIYLKRV